MRFMDDVNAAIHRRRFGAHGPKPCESERSLTLSASELWFMMSSLRLAYPFKRAGHVIHRRREQQRVDAIEDAAVTGNERRAVLHAGAALQHRLEQIAGDAERRRRRRRAARAARTGTAGSHHAPTTTSSSVPKTNPPTAPSIVFFGLIARRQRRASERPAGVVLRGVADDDGQHQQEERLARRGSRESRSSRRSASPR